MNTEERSKYNKTYYEKNKSKIQVKYKEIVECPICKSKISKAHFYTQHKRSRKCLKIKQEMEDDKKEKMKYINKEDIETLKILLEKLKLDELITMPIIS